MALCEINSFTGDKKSRILVFPERSTWCCGCCSVRCGTITIALVWLVLNAYLVYASNSIVLTEGGRESNIPVNELEKIFEIDHGTFVKALAYGLFIGGLLNVSFSTALIFSAIQDELRQLLLPWLIFNICCTLLLALFTIVPAILWVAMYGLAVGPIVALGCCCILLALFLYSIRDMKKSRIIVYPEKSTWCCGCCSVRCGTITIALVWLVVNSYLFYKTGTKWKPNAETEFQSNEAEKTPGQIFGVSRETFVTALAYTFLIGSLSNMITSTAMIYTAVNRGPRQLLLPWLFFNTFCAVLWIVLAILPVFYMFIVGLADGAIVAMVCCFILFTLFAYSVRVVDDYYEDLREREGACCIEPDGDGQVVLNIHYDA